MYIIMFDNLPKKYERLSESLSKGIQKENTKSIFGKQFKIFYVKWRNMNINGIILFISFIFIQSKFHI